MASQVSSTGKEWPSPEPEKDNEMKPTNKIAPVIALAVLMGLSGAMIATAQGLEAEATEETVTPVQVRHGDRDGEGRGHRGGEMLRELFGAADTNGDQSVTAEELAALRTARLAAADANADGSLTLDEFQTVWLELMNPRMVDAFQNVDADGDAVITVAELEELEAKMMDRMDRNGDGAINRDDRGRGRD
jgi:Ca2+-binding EF-hand superfamily protein